MSFACRTPSAPSTTAGVFDASAVSRLQRACACGQHTSTLGECQACRGSRLGLQRRPALSTPGDRLERAADEAADRVMRMVDPGAIAPGPAAIQAQCADCEDDRPHTVQCSRESTTDAGAALDTGVAERVAAGGGAPLPDDVRSFFQTRFGHDFGRVRVHTGGDADRGARAVGARAYTLGHNIVFAAGQYAPATPGGRRLLAHELAHVVQQRAAAPIPAAVGPPGGAPAPGPASAVVQRACGAALGPPVPDCTPSDRGVVGWPFRFRVNCDDLLAGEADQVSKLTAGSTLNVHGFASIEGPTDFNQDLSCHRANRIVELLRARRPDCTVAGVFEHGASPRSQPGAVPDANPRAFWRTVVVEEVKGAPEPPAPKAVCGPDATDWLVKQVVAAKRNARVLAVRSKLDVAAHFAAGIEPAGQLDAAEILEGAVLDKLTAAWTAAGKPPATGDAKAQMAQAAMGAIAFDTAKLAALGLDPDAVTTLQALRDASLQWKALVGTGRPLDFKNDPSTMGHPTSASCPDDCAGTITLCPGSKGFNCFGKDLPGNIVYAAVGAFVGFSENALQLGSQFAQLTSSKAWDPPEDTQMISVGFALPQPITRAGLCAALQSAKGGFGVHACRDCHEPTTAAIVDPP